MGMVQRVNEKLNGKIKRGDRIYCRLLLDYFTRTTKLAKNVSDKELIRKARVRIVMLLLLNGNRIRAAVR